ncbi:MAG: anaerobic sulfatase maturase [Bryobacteraceae bacterium]|nr:anaerobic sulfatase maturase [Bryobacteraceae bacterium]
MPAGNPFPILGADYPLATISGPAPRIGSVLVKPASAVCNLDCEYCFYLDREADPYRDLPARIMPDAVLERLVDGFLFYSYPVSVFAFQGGEPTLAGLSFFEKLIEFQKKFGRRGQAISNSIQTNGILLDDAWCSFLRQYEFLAGISLDGPEEIHDRYRVNRAGHPTWRKVIEAVERMQKHRAEFNILCVVSQANVGKPRELYRFFRSIGAEHLQFIPLAEFHPDGTPMPFTITPEQYGRFLCELFDAWWPDRRRVRIRFFDNLAEALAGIKPGSCTLHEGCDSYVVVEYNGDVYPCDFFVESGWKLGNLMVDSFAEIARRQRRQSFASKKALPHEECRACEFFSVCRGGCPKLRHGPRRNFGDLDYFCAAYKMIFSRAVGPLRRDVEKILGANRNAAVLPGPY